MPEIRQGSPLHVHMQAFAEQMGELGRSLHGVGAAVDHLADAFRYLLYTTDTHGRYQVVMEGALPRDASVAFPTDRLAPGEYTFQVESPAGGLVQERLTVLPEERERRFSVHETIGGRMVVQNFDAERRAAPPTILGHDTIEQRVAGALGVPADMLSSRSVLDAAEAMETLARSGLLDRMTPANAKKAMEDILPPPPPPGPRRARRIHLDDE